VIQNADPKIVTLNDDWAVLGDDGNTEFTLGDNASFRMQIVDAGSLINANTATEEQLARLPLTQEQIDSLLDWRDVETQARPNGAKDDYYNQLPEPYNARLFPLTVTSELLLVRGWTANRLYEVPEENENVVTTAIPLNDTEGNPVPLISVLTVDSGVPNVRFDGTERVNFGAVNLNATTLTQFGLDATTAQRIAAQGTYTNFAALLNEPGISTDSAGQLLDAVTFTNGDRVPGKININTASQTVLETLPDMLPDVAASIVSRQAAGGFTRLSELTTVSGMSGGLLPRIADAVTVGSDTWIVRADGESGGVVVPVEVVVGIRNGQARVLTWERVAGQGIPQRWGWESEPTSTVEAGTQ
jgi:DNA uptake protein ComE-like DNA-binding protein